MVAILDTNALDGQTPGVEGTRWECQGCAPGRPIRYILMPRSEVNRASAFRFNRARLEVLADRIVVRAIEWENEPAGLAADILYEFTPSLRLMRASHSEMYWQMHRSLEAEGKIDHSRQQCPDRDGPAPIRAWEPASGWTTVALR